MNREQAFGLPKGTVRAVLALVLVGAFVYAVLIEMESQGVTALAAMAGSAVTFYFQKRGQEDRNDC